MPFTAFISDLHLTLARAEINRIFFAFLEGPARAADHLYILGDLFEYWLGDDDLRDPLNAQVASGLKALVTAGVPVSVMHGNRDVLLLKGFAQASGARLIADPTVVDLYGTRTLLLHGDSLCTDDLQYQAFRKRARNFWWQRAFLLQPLSMRRAQTERGRRKSERQKRINAAEIMDVTPAAVEQAFRDSGCIRMIHGHTHRPARHVHIVEGRTCERWVLSDWYQHGQYLRIGPDGCTSVDLT